MLTPLLAPWWQVRAVELASCPGLPPSVAASLQGLVGGFPLSVDPQWVRRQVEVWPVVAAVDVRLQLPGTLLVTATPVDPEGSVPRGRRWQAVAGDGGLAGPLTVPLQPVLVGFPTEPTDLRRGLAVARRLQAASGGTVHTVRRVTPTDLEVRLRPPGLDHAVVVRVRPEVTAGERLWCATAAGGSAIPPWADLRWDDRMVIGGLG